MKENRFINAIKFIACLFVITIHAPFPGEVGKIIGAVARFAVPFFFVVSGRFLLFRRDGSLITEVPDIRRKTTRTLSRLLKTTGIVYLIHLLFSLFVQLKTGTPFSEWFTSKFNLFEARNFFLFNSGQFIYDWTYTFDHMWFLFALIYVYGLIYIFAPVLRKWYKRLIAILLGFLFFGELLQTYYPIRPFDISISTWYVMRNWLFVGIPFVMIGILFGDIVSKREKPFGKTEMTTGILLILIGIISVIAELNIIGSKEVYLGSVIIVIGILILSECKIRVNDLLCNLGKRASSRIYFFHVLVIALIDILSQNGVIHAPSQALKTVLVMGICIILFYILPLLTDKLFTSRV